MQRYSAKLDRLIPFIALFSSLGILAAVFYISDQSDSYWLYDVRVDVTSWVIICMPGAGFLRYFPMPAGASAARIYVGTFNIPDITLSSLTLEIN